MSSYGMTRRSAPAATSAIFLSHQRILSEGWSAVRVHLNLVRLGERYARLLESQFDAPAEFARDVVLAVQHGANLHAKHGAIQRERFDSENARAVHQSDGPVGGRTEIARDFLERSQSAAHQFIAGNGDVDESLRPIAAQVGHLTDQSVGNRDERPG